MNTHWPPPAKSASRLHPAVCGGMAGRFELVFRRHGDRTRIGRQFVSYPFHLTRPFSFDPAIPSLTTLYQQSSSGGLYRAEQLSVRLELEPDAAAHVTTQAATVVHDCHGERVSLNTEISLAENAFLALTPDPYVLFPGAWCAGATQATLAPGAVLLLADAFACHDPAARARAFERFDGDVALRDPSGRLLVRDRFTVSGEAFAATPSPVGRWPVVANYLLAGDAARLPDRRTLEQAGEMDGLVAGVSALPNGAGWGVRALAADAIAVRRFAERLFVLSVEAAFGTTPMPRRK